MRPMVILWCGLVLSFIASLALGIVTIRTMNVARAAVGKASDAVMRYAVADRTLQLDLVDARAGLLRNYDPINADLIAQRASTAELGRLPLRAKARAILAGLIVCGDRQALLVEQFKSDNALLQNSLARLAAVENDASRRENLLSTRLFKLTLDTSPQTVVAARAALRSAPPPRGGTAAAQFLAHATLVVVVLPEIDGLLNAIRAMRPEGRIVALRAALIADAREDLTVVYWLQVALAVAVFLFVATGITLVSLQRLLTHDLLVRAENERLSAAITMPLIDTGPENFGSGVQEAIGQLALHIGAKHLQLLLPDSSGTAVFSWPEASLGPHWLRQFTQAAEADDAWKDDRVIAAYPGAKVATTLHRAMGDAGVGDLVLLRVGEPHRVVIGMETGRHAFAQRGDHMAAVMSVIVAIAHGARREALREERERHGRTLARARRMEMIGAMASGVAHNFNNIVAAIGGFAEIGQEHTKSGSAARYNFDEIRAAVDRSRDLVDNILNFAKHGRAIKQPIDLLTVLTQTIRLLSASAPDDGAFRLSGSRERHIVLGAGSDLQQVVLNISTNAAQASDGRPVDIMVQRRDLSEAREMSHGRLGPGRYVAISIRDAGSGIAEGVRERLFAPFFTTKAGGTGLGLSTAWEVVRDHGGTIDVTNSAGGGAQFVVWLPEMPADPAARVVGDGARILLVTAPERLAAEEEMLAELGFEPLGFALTADPALLRAAIDDCEAIIVAAAACGVAEALVDRIGGASGTRPLFLAVPGGGTVGASARALSYPFDVDEVSRLLVQTLSGALQA